MSFLPVQTLSLIGAGNVAAFLGAALKRHGIRIAEVYNRTPAHGRLLARRLDAAYRDDLADMDPRTDLILISVSDSAVEEIAGKLKTSALVAHTSGSVDLASLAPASPRTGVFYPLQSFRKGRRVLLKDVPFCIEAANPDDEAILAALARTLSGKPCIMDSRRRRILHLSAVFATNFPNFLYSVAETIVEEQGIPFDLLRPVISQTAGNAGYKDVFSLQTGPAVREDLKVLGMHRDLLRDHPDYLKLYDLLSNSIIQEKHRHGKL